jgi:hypothetical protein
MAGSNESEIAAIVATRCEEVAGSLSIQGSIREVLSGWLGLGRVRISFYGDIDLSTLFKRHGLATFVL